MSLPPAIPLRERLSDALDALGLEPPKRALLEALVDQALQTELDADVMAVDSVAATVSVVALDLDDDHDDLAEALDLRVPLPERYVDLGGIGAGSMGVVRRVRDRTLNRVLAMKILRDDLPNPRLALFRFVEEARITAQLEHPGIVPVHDFGQLPEGSWYFTATEARGRRLTDVIREVHRDRLEKGGFSTTTTSWTFRRLVDAFRKVCEAVAYAHARGVVHRDLKPDNILVGSFGEVLVLDWGLARLLDRTERPTGVSPEEIGPGERNFATRDGVVTGTPAFMAPEQARGEVDRISPATDVYALGGVLYMILYGHHPYQDLGAREVLARVRKGPPPFPPAPWAPLHLVTVCRRAMQGDAGARYPDASLLAGEIDAWLEGARTRDRARIMVQRVSGRITDLTMRYTEAVQARERCRRNVARLGAQATLQEKETAWAEEDGAEDALERVEDAFQDVVQQLRAALTQCPDLLEGRAALADLYRARYDTAVALGQAGRARGFERLVQEYDVGRHAAFLARQGRLTLRTDPPGAQVEVYRYETRGRRLVREPVELLGPGPLEGHVMTSGSYLLVIRAPGRRLVHYPVEIPREGHWMPMAPGTVVPRPIPLPRESAVDPSLVYVPEGWTVLGGDPDARGGLPRQRLWMYGFFVGRDPITHGEYLEFLNGLVAEGRASEALERVPRTPAGRREEPVPLYRLGAGRTFEPLDDTPAGPYAVEAPVTFVRWHDAVAWCLWKARTTGLPYRLVGEAEREKAARGVDGRTFPWGDHSDPAFHCTHDTALDPATPPPPALFPVDTSPYGVRGLAGGVADWCMDIYRQRGPGHEGSMLLPPEALSPGDEVPTGPGQRRVVRGGAFDGPARVGRSASRGAAAAGTRRAGLGFRVAFTLEALRRVRSER